MKKFQGKVVSTKMNNTVVVEVVFKKRHPLYKKSISVAKKYLADERDGKVKMGDIVEIVENRPISKRKKWKVSKVKQ